tara:strand:- start:414 stop:587 length:174 start_codon:yes stop_codon:yes gene_type:complete
MANEKHTESLETLLAFVSQEVDVSEMIAGIKAKEEEEEDERGEETSPNHGPVEGISL